MFRVHSTFDYGLIFFEKIFNVVSYLDKKITILSGLTFFIKKYEFSKYILKIQIKNCRIYFYSIF